MPSSSLSKSVTEKILGNHLVALRNSPGQEIAIKIDQTLTQDATGTMTYQQLEALTVDRVKTLLSVSYIDHNTIQLGPENADDHRYLQTVAARYGVIFSRAGNGICHQVHLENFSKPGQTLLGSDSHTCTCGAMGMIAIGAGGLDVAAAMAGNPFFLTSPKIVKVDLKGRLNRWVAAKDVILSILEIFGTNGNAGYIFEYGGEGLQSLTVPERATIANMGAECGAITSVFPSDGRTKEFLSTQGRKNDWLPIEADNGAVYEKVVEIDLNEIVPKIAYPHSPGNIKKVGEVAGMKVQQICIGSCTNSSYKDLVIASQILKDKKIHPDVSLVIAPGSRQVLQMITRRSALDILLRSGARIQECACGFCVGNSLSPMTNGVSLRTNNRNFLGRSGTKSGEIYLCSPETAAASAITGELTDPRNLDIPYPHVEMPAQLFSQDDLFIKPATKVDGVRVYRGPHMGQLPVNSPLPKVIQGQISIKLGDNITTDYIIPAGKRMKYRSNIAKYAEYVFEIVDASFPNRAAMIRDKGKYSVIVAGFSYGQGSSREHAALCPMYLGVRVVLAKSFERIHVTNLINFGILPLSFIDESDYQWIEHDDELEISDIHNALRNNDRVTVIDKTKERSFEASFAVSEREKEIIIMGGKLPYLKQISQNKYTDK